jgi:1-acyl-sn-glycerol-3-phosphate acyltransferase
MSTGIKSFLVSIYIWGFLFITIIPMFIIYALIWIISYPFDPNKILTHYYTSLWAGLYLAINPGWKISIEGKQNINHMKPHIFISNHQSLLDVALLFQLYIKFKWVSKIELVKIPVLGWVIRMSKHIIVRRGDKESIIQMAEACKKSLSEGISIFIFPEGTRSEDGKLRPFKDGAFILAKETGVSILPVFLHGASTALPKKSFIFKGRQHIRIRVLEEITKDTINKLSLEELITHTWRIMSESLEQIDREKAF